MKYFILSKNQNVFKYNYTAHVLLYISSGLKMDFFGDLILSGAKFINHFTCSAQQSMNLKTAHKKLKCWKIQKFFLLLLY